MGRLKDSKEQSVTETLHPLDCDLGGLTILLFLMYSISKYPSMNFRRKIMEFTLVWENPFLPSKQLPNRHLLIQANNGNTSTMCDICSKLEIKTPERRYFGCCSVFINFKQNSHNVLFPLLTIKKKMMVG